jgi:hypothetical protein
MTRGDRGRDIIRLLAGDCFEDPPLSASLAMRRSLCNLPALDALEGRARTIAERVHQRYDFFQGVDAAYIDPSAQGIRLWFHLGDDDIDLYDSIHDFEEELIADVGRDDLAILSFTPEMSEAAPSEAGAMRIFDRRARG